MNKLVAEFVGTAILLATVIGSGIMGETLSGGNVAIALLGNTLPTGAILYVLITIFAPISGAHFNPAVTLVFALRKDIQRTEAVSFVAVQIIGGILGVWIAHLMFDQSVFQISVKDRGGMDQGFSEIVATFGLVLVILGGLKYKVDAIPMLVGLYITAAYWFTASTSFANPAVTLARCLSDTFAGINPANAPLFILCQIFGALLAWLLAKQLFPKSS